jgi:penicillin-binding protein 2
MASIDLNLPERPADVGRIRIFIAVVCLGLLAIIGRLWYLQIAHGEELQEASIINQRRLIRRVPPRGKIEDRNGKVLATNRSQIVVSVIPYELKKNPEVLPLLANLLDTPLEEINAILEKYKNNRYDAIRVAEDVPIEAVTRIEEQRQNLPGVYVGPEPIRDYPDGALCGHLLGQMGQIPPEELKARREEGYRPGDTCGKLGLERAYDAHLRGTNGGREIEVDARGRMRKEVGSIEPIPGCTLTLTLDKECQKIAHEELSAWASGQKQGASKNGNAGAVVAIDPQTGGVIVLSSVPSYDPNEFVKGIKIPAWNKLRDNPLHPLVNRAVGSRYAPGSTFKVITALAGLETGKATVHSSDHCGGGIMLGRWRKRCHKTSGHGGVNFDSALASSCDVFFYHLGQRLGPDAMAKYARMLGLGSRTGIDLVREGDPQVETAGLVPDPAWKLARRKEEWLGGDTVDMAIGQSMLGCSPLQMCNVAAAIGNRGTIYKPQMVKRITKYDAANKPTIIHQLQPEVMRRLAVSPANLQSVVKAMGDVMKPGGTAPASAVPGIEMAGKTGTAQVRGPDGVMRNNAWFIAFAPIDKPRIAICVFIEHGGHGGAVAAPIAKKIIAKYLGIKLQQEQAEEHSLD